MNRLPVAAIVFAAAASAAAAPERTALATFSADELQSAYLECELAATTGLVNAGDAAPCSLIYEELKERVFGGDFDRMIAWWQTQRRALHTRSSATAR